LKKPFGKVVTVAVLMAFLLSSFVVAGGFNKAEAQESESSEVSAASGSNRFVVWADNTPGNNEILFGRSTDNGATWQPITNLSSNPGDSLRPQIAASGSNVYVVWTQINSEGTSGDVFVRKSANNGATWKPLVDITESDASQTELHLTALGANVYVIWIQASPDNGAFEIMFRRSTDNGATWKPVINLSNNPGHSNSPEITTSGSNVYVVWVQVSADSTKIDIQLRRSTDNGATWKSITKISSNAGTSIAPHVAAKGSTVYVVWQDDTPGNYDILSRRSTNNGAAWDTIRNLSNSTGISSFPQLAV
jgi:hypothetical protein